jgi:hypothetical protein
MVAGSILAGIAPCLIASAQAQTAQTAQTVHTAIRTDDFINALGMGIHLGNAAGPYASAPTVLASLKYLGISHVRDNAAIVSKANSWQWAKDSVLINGGIKFTGAIPSNPPTLVANMEPLASAIDYIEGPNEVDYGSYSYNGLTGISAGVAMQKAIYPLVKVSSSLSKIPVLNLTVSSAPNSKTAGDLSSVADFTNIHVYTCIAQPLVSYQIVLAQTVDTPNKPLIVTETGMSTVAYNAVSAKANGACGVTQDVQAKYMLDDVFDAIRLGAVKVFLYELADDSVDAANTSAEQHFGFYDANWNPKESATALHNLTTILKDSSTAGSTFTPATLTYALTDANATLPINFTNFSMLLQKNGGPYEVVVWNEQNFWNATTHAPITPTTHNVTLTLAKAASKMAIYDPIKGTTSSAPQLNSRAIVFAVTDHPVIIEVTP